MFSSSTKAPGDAEHRGGEEVKFYYTWSCPFCQIAWIALNHLKIRHRLIEINARNDHRASVENDKQLLKINPKGTVPTLYINGEVHTESIDTVAYLHYHSGNNTTDPNFVTESLMKDAYTMSQRLVSTYFSIYTKSSPIEEDKVWEKFEASLSLFAIQIHDGGYFKSPTMNVVDVVVFPFAVRLCLIKAFRGRELDMSVPWVQTLMDWLERMMRRVEVRETVAAENEMIEGWRDILVKIGARV